MKFVVYTKPDCGYCVMVKKLMNENNLEYDEVDITQDHEAHNFVVNVKKHRTVPQIYLDGQLFVEGGYQGMKKHIQEQKDTQELLNSLGGI
jgi:glutaredoxin